MRIMTPETKVGLFTILAGIALLYLSIKTTGGTFWERGKQKTVYANFSSVAGVELQSKVRLSGVEIGYVDAIALEDSHARVTIKLVRPDAVIREDSMATIRTEGLLGEKYIEIVQGTPDAPQLQAGATIKRVQEPADISDMTNKIALALDDVKEITNSLKNVFGTEQGQLALKNILNNIDTSSEHLKRLLEENNKAIRQTIQNFAKISDEFAKTTPSLMENLDEVAVSLKEVIRENRKDLNEGISNLNAMLKENRKNIAQGVTNLRDVSSEFNEILRENRENLKRLIDNLASASDKIDDAMASVKGTSDSFRSMSDSFERVASKIERGEGTVGKLISDEEVYDNLNETLLGANKLVNKAEDIKLYLGFRGEKWTDQDESKAFVSLKIQPRADKQYIVEVSEDIRRTDIDARNTLNSLLYTILVAKRYSDLNLRGGLIESSAGLGLDYYLFGDRIILSAETFNFSGYNDLAPNPQVRAVATWRFQKYLFVYLGGDELANEEYRTFLLGGGILFDDDDLKLALGLL